MDLFILILFVLQKGEFKKQLGKKLIMQGSGPMVHICHRKGWRSEPGDAI